MTTVALLRCTRYEHALLKETIMDGLAKISFNFKQLDKAKVALKPNLLTAAPIEKAVVTDPTFFKAVSEIVIDHGGKPILAESPGFTSLASVIKAVGYDSICKNLGIEVASMGETEVLHNRRAKIFQRIEIARAFCDVDMILNLPKFKTHELTYVTGALKNLFGTIPGLKKSQMHMRCPQNPEFSEWLLDLYSTLLYGFDKPKPIYTIMDAIIGQEGDGPGTSGTPRAIGAVIIGQDPIAIDYVATSVVGLDYRKVATITQGFKREFAVSFPEEIQIYGESIASLKINNFKPPHTPLSSRILSAPVVGPLVKNLMVEKPWPSASTCTLCYKCKTICPAKAISEARGYQKTPQYDYKKCIRCFCCMEICPEAAITLKKTLLSRLLR